MARLDIMTNNNGKKLQIGHLLPDEMRDIKEVIENENEDGTIEKINVYKEDFVTIYKLSFEDKTKIKMLSLKTFSANTQKEIAKRLKQKGKTLKDLQDIDTEDNEAVQEILMEIDYVNLETDKMADSTINLSRFIIEKGLDTKQHSFKNSKNKKIELNYDILNKLGNENLIKYISDNIKIYSKGLELGE